MRAGRASGILASGVHMLKFSGNRDVRTRPTLLLHAETVDCCKCRCQCLRTACRSSFLFAQVVRHDVGCRIQDSCGRLCRGIDSLHPSFPRRTERIMRKSSHHKTCRLTARASSFIPPSTWPPSLLLFIRQQHRPVKPSELLRGGLQHEKHSQRQSEFCPLDMKPFLASTARALLSLRPPPLSASTTNQLVFRCDHIHSTRSLQSKMRSAPEQAQISTSFGGGHMLTFFF